MQYVLSRQYFVGILFCFVTVFYDPDLPYYIKNLHGEKSHGSCLDEMGILDQHLSEQVFQPPISNTGNLQ